MDDVAINGKVITMTGDTDDTAVFTAGTNGALTITTTDTAGAAANITITADGTAELALTTVTLNSSGGVTLDADNGTITFSDAGVSLGTITSSGYSGNAATATTAGTANALATSTQNAVEISPHGTSSGNTGEIRLLELAANGTNYVGFKSPDSIASNTIYTLPNAYPGENRVLQSTSAGSIIMGIKCWWWWRWRF